MSYEANKAIAREFFEAINWHDGCAMADRPISSKRNVLNRYV